MTKEVQVAIFIILASLIAVIASWYMPEKITVYNTVVTEDQTRTWYLTTEGK